MRRLYAGAVILAMLLSGTVSPAAQSSGADSAASAASQQVHKLKITVLVTNVAGDPRAGDGEWGYAALVEVDGHKILYDTGASEDMALRNAKILHIDLSDVDIAAFVSARAPAHDRGYPPKTDRQPALRYDS